MESGYKDHEAKALIDELGPAHGEDLALRVYTSRLLGLERELVLHGGGNTSVKSTAKDIFGEPASVLFIKGSGHDLATIGPSGFPACRLAHLRRCCELPSMSDVEMVTELRGQMMNPSSPTPSVEALLHAYLPAKFIDHTHADAVLAVVDQPDSGPLVREVLGEAALFIPYVMPGFALAKSVAEAWSAARDRGETPSMMILDKHGIFTWGETAKESYERMIDAVTLCEKFVKKCLANRDRRTGRMEPLTPHESMGSIARGALHRATGRTWIARWRSSGPLLDFMDREDLDEVSSRGCITPDHVIRTKSHPLVLPFLDGKDRAATSATIEGAVARYAEAYHAYFERCSAARETHPKALDPWPRVLLFPGIGVMSVGRTEAEASIVADVYEHTASVIDAALAIGDYAPVSELDLFDVEYWSLEQAKLAKSASHDGPLARRVAMVTGAGSGIGLATARALLLAGAYVLVTDFDEEAAEKRALELNAFARGRVRWSQCDVMNKHEVRDSVRYARDCFGGLDVVVSNAGGVFQGPLHTEAGDLALRESLELNLLGHQNVARVASEVMIAQGTGGALLFNASKSAFNQGPGFGPYAVAKAALLALMRQYAVDLGPFGIRSSAVNADRVRTELFGAGVLEERAKARGLAPDDYFKANLLHRETTVDDVAEAFVYLAAANATTGAVVTVDGGNAAAFPR